MARAVVSGAAQIKEKLGGLVIHSNRNTPFWEGFKRMLTRYSEQVCIRYGKPGRMRNVRMTAAGPKYTGGWMRPRVPEVPQEVQGLIAPGTNRPAAEGQRRRMPKQRYSAVGSRPRRRCTRSYRATSRSGRR